MLHHAQVAVKLIIVTRIEQVKNPNHFHCMNNFYSLSNRIWGPYMAPTFNVLLIKLMAEG